MCVPENQQQNARERQWARAEVQAGNPDAIADLVEAPDEVPLVIIGNGDTAKKIMPKDL